jgi:hypothetical protein
LRLPTRTMNWRESPAHWTYRAISRYIRRHVVRELDRYGPESTPANGQRQVASLLRLDQYKQIELMELDWAQRLDEQFHLQPLPFLSPWNVETPSLVENFLSAKMLSSPDLSPCAPDLLNQTARCWLDYHASGMAMMARLREVAQKVGNPASVIRGSLQVDSRELSSLCDWSAVLGPNGSLRFLSLTSPGPIVLAMESSGPDKTARRQIVIKAREAADRRLLNACTGPCLTWNNPEGWHVSASVKPGKGQWHLHRLFGVQGAK